MPLVWLPITTLICMVQSLSGTLALEFCLYIVCIIGAQIALIQASLLLLLLGGSVRLLTSCAHVRALQLLQRVSKEAHVQYPLAASVAVSFVFFFLPFSQDLLPGECVVSCVLSV